MAALQEEISALRQRLAQISHEFEFDDCEDLLLQDQGLWSTCHTLSWKEHVVEQAPQSAAKSTYLSQLESGMTKEEDSSAREMVKLNDQKTTSSVASLTETHDATENEDEEDSSEGSLGFSFESSKDGEEEDSAWYCPTVKHEDILPATKRQSRLRQPLQSIRSSFNAVKSPLHGIRTVHIDHSAPQPNSPSAMTNITFDASVRFEEEFHQPMEASSLDDNTSVQTSETAFLDRYRLDADESSPYGFRVVPNQRRSTHGKAPRPAVISMTTPQAFKPPQKTVSFQTPAVSVRSQAQRPHRKTPYRFPSKLLPQVEEENTPSNNYPRTPLSKKPPRASTPLTLDTTRSSIRPSSIRSTRRRPRVALVTKQEYDASPRVVRVQVSYAQVVHAIECINRPSSGVPVQLSKLQAQALWSLDMKQTERMLWSLAHWKRLMLRCGDGEPVFDVLCAS